MIKVNVMAKLNTVPDTALNDIEEFLEIWTFEVEKWRKVKIDSRRIFYIKNEKGIFDSKFCFSGNCDFQHNYGIFVLKGLLLSFRNFCEIMLFYDMLEFWIIRRNGLASPS